MPLITCAGPPGGSTAPGRAALAGLSHLGAAETPLHIGASSLGSARHGPRLSRRTALDRRLGALLCMMRDQEAFRALGFVRLGDYVAERLGLGQRTAQELMRVERALEGLPLAAAAFERPGRSPQGTSGC